jgi:3-deoxy-7-phosphoheptulonate synthase
MQTKEEKFKSIKENKKGRPVSVGNVLIGGPQFTVIAGPCSIESEDQFSETAHFVKDNGAAILRGGIWKLRTQPQAFQGLPQSQERPCSR